MRYLLVACAGKDYSMPIGHTSLYVDLLTRLFLDRLLAFAFLTPEKQFQPSSTVRKRA
jgi:hypothetical protein